MPIDLTPIVKPLTDAAQPAIDAISDAWAMVLGDRFAIWRVRNAANLQIKLNAELKRLGLSLNQSKIPERYAFAWFEEATKHDDPEIQKLFARLLAKASSGDDDASDCRNLEILARFTPMDAKVLEIVFRREGIGNGRGTVDEYELWRALKEEEGKQATLSLEHLINLGLLERHYKVCGASAVSIPWASIDSARPAGPFVGLSEGLSVILCARSYRWKRKDHRYGDRQGSFGSVAGGA